MRKSECSRIVAKDAGLGEGSGSNVQEARGEQKATDVGRNRFVWQGEARSKAARSTCLVSVAFACADRPSRVLLNYVRVHLQHARAMGASRRETGRWRRVPGEKPTQQ